MINLDAANLKRFRMQRYAGNNAVTGRRYFGLFWPSGTGRNHTWDRQWRSKRERDAFARGLVAAHQFARLAVRLAT